MRTSNAYALIKLDAQPLERFDDVIFGSWHKTVGVGILDSQQNLATILLGEQVVVQCGTDPTYMKGSCGTWCKAHTNFLSDMMLNDIILQI